MADRAVVFIDGNNWFHSLRHVGVQSRLLLDYRKIAEKLLGPREWVATKYYIGQVSQAAIQFSTHSNGVFSRVWNEPILEFRFVWDA
jgi:hypothetical protein